MFSLSFPGSSSETRLCGPTETGLNRPEAQLSNETRSEGRSTGGSTKSLGPNKTAGTQQSDLSFVDLWNFPRAWTLPDEYDNLARRVQLLAARFGELAKGAEVVGNGMDMGPVVRVAYLSHLDADEAVASLHGLDNRTNKQKRSGVLPIPSIHLFVARWQTPGRVPAELSPPRVGNRGDWVPPSEVAPIPFSEQSCSEAAKSSVKATTDSGKEKATRKLKPKQISDEEWSGWQERADIFQTRGVASQPDLIFQDLFRERNRCRDRSYILNSFLLRIGFFCNSDHLLDVTAGPIECSLEEFSRDQKILAVLLNRFSGSPQEEEKPGKSGAAVVAKHIKQDSPEDFAAYVKQMPFSGRHTDRATLSGNELAIIATDVAIRIAAQIESLSLDTWTKQINTISKEVGHQYQIVPESMRKEQRKASDNTHRRVAFHGLQVALDLEGVRIITISDSSNSCPLAMGLWSGVTHMKRWQDPNATIEELAKELGVPARHVQTALCEYNKYVKWFSGVDKIRPR